ncbi:MAG: hypothetical protein FMNOHCHN_01525 [Ignavibacteriaceae bacterium]|nr:hypothetical protein [Ignavibacteriaceae bacterium]
MKYSTITIQGNLLSEEILQKADTAEAQGQKAADFGFEPGTNLRSEIEYAWSRIKLDWKHFSDKSQNLPASDPYGTTLSRRWMEQFFSTLGFALTRQKTNLTGENQKTYAISHTASNLDELPVLIVGFNEPDRPEKNTLDIKTSGGTTRLSPHATMQEYLNVTEHLYGIAANGLYLRLIRDSGRLIKLTYIEFDLKRMLDEDKYSEFTLLYRLLHASRFPKTKAEADQCLLEKYYQESIESGNRIRDGLSNAVKTSLLALGNGFLKHEHNSDLREKLITGSLTPKEFYRQLLRIIYRFLFLMVTEERDLIYEPENKSADTLRFKNIYLKFYSIARLRKLSESKYIYETQFTDLWLGLLQTFRLFEEDGSGIKLGIQPLAGDLFSYHAIKDLQGTLISNKLLLECIRNMNEFADEENNLVAVNYRSLDVEELGSVYEGLLDLHPVIENIDAVNPAQIHFTFHEGTERKTTGSYYTRPELVNELIKSALIPVIEERLKEHGRSRKEQAQALLRLKVCDAAAGSGHMILAAARTIAWYLARVESGEENPAPSVYRTCLREVIQHCIYAVDLNPDAVELCKLALWLEGHNSGKPLSFLDHKIRNGNSLVGVTDLTVLKKGIPDEAYKPVTGDDKQVCSELKKINSSLRNKGQLSLDKGQWFLDFEKKIPVDTASITKGYLDLESQRQDDLEGVKQAKKKFESLRSDPAWFKEWRACNIWTAAFFFTYTKDTRNAAPTTERLEDYLANTGSAYGPMIGAADSLSLEHKFFHWPLEFPDVFEQGGFDVMLGNPPWERIKLQQQEFFSMRDAAIAKAPNAAARKKMIQDMQKRNPELFNEYEKALHFADAAGKFLRDSGRYVLTAVGDINTYSVFAELTSALINPRGRTAIIVPTGIATDDSNKKFFSAFVTENRLVSLFDFENKEAIFPAVHRSYKFCLLTLSGLLNKHNLAMFGFFLTRVEHLQDKMRVFNLSKEDFLRLNPNTKTCPVFRTRVDAELTTKIYKQVPVLVNEEKGENPWQISFMRMFDMSNDSHLFRTREQLEAEGFKLWGNKMKRGSELWLPLYEGKMCHYFNHRATKVYFNWSNANRPVQQNDTTVEELQNPDFVAESAYYISSVDLLNVSNIQSHLFGFKSVTSPTNERTMIGTIIPFSGVSNSFPLIQFVNTFSNKVRLLFYCNMSTIVLDFVAKQKIGGVNLNFFYVNQFPVLHPESYLTNFNIKVCITGFELFYSSWDIKTFADDIWKEADEELRKQIQKQWEENKAVTGGHNWNPPVWCEIDPDGCPLPPFKWDEKRRALLKAELDAIYAKLYGLSTEELRYILDPQDVYGPDFPGETFRVLKEKETRLYGEYRTRRLVLEEWERLNKEKT